MSSQLTLLTEFKIDDKLILKNRVIMAPLTRARCGRTQVPNEAVVEYYTQRASAGLIVSEGTMISKQGNGWGGAAAIHGSDHVKGWQKVTKSVHDAGGAIFCQLWHMGRVTAEVFHGLHPVGPSALAATGHSSDYEGNKMEYVVPRVLGTDEIATVVEEYRLAAVNAKEAGFDGIELHSANGYLLDIFLQSCSNTRTDRYGGSFENRFRIVQEVLDAVLTVFPSSRVAIRLSPNGTYNTMGSADNFDAFTYYLTRLNQYKLGFVHLMDGLGWGSHGLCKQLQLADARKVFYGPIAGNAGYEKLTAEGAINTGAAELIAFGRDFISNPDLVERFQNNWPLNEPADRAVWWMYPSFPDGNPNVGYTDFPKFSADL